ncbi:MAG: uroporphyrinogen-III C-methyltransferase [Pseudobacteriovorax sp.]|nr:uroporphyrinogen-III C-methyltransferase [Pseudobacteriovorax sp.]
MGTGHVYLVGAGPGDPDLLTIKAMKAISKADVIYYDSLLSKDILNYAKDSCELIHVGKRSGNHTLPQETIEILLTRSAAKGKQVVRLKGGDPFIFGRGGEEVDSLKKYKIPFEIIPGVSAMNGVAAGIGLPVTQRHQSNSIMAVEGHTLGKRPQDYPRLVAFPGTIAIYMGSKKNREIAQNLILHGAGPERKMLLVETTPSLSTIEHFHSLAFFASGQVSKKTEGPGILYLGPTVERFKVDQNKTEGELNYEQAVAALF